MPTITLPLSTAVDLIDALEHAYPALAIPGAYSVGSILETTTGDAMQDLRRAIAAARVEEFVSSRAALKPYAATRTDADREAERLADTIGCPMLGLDS